MNRNIFIQLRVNQAEAEAYRQLAESRGETLSELIRNRLDRLVAARQANMAADADQ